MPVIGVVIIGRNEGERLTRCILSLHQHISNSIYVDSASTDGSLETATKLGVHSLALDMSMPFTAARARNKGFEVLLMRLPEAEFVQFIDGDCEVLDNWVEVAVDFLLANSQVAVVSGVLNERFPEKTIYNTLCDFEWKMPIGEVKACGGNAMMRVSAFKAENGFLPALIAGEEPELCVRLRQAGWKVWHLKQAMMLHDANMATFGQWWTRTTRAGYAFAQGASMHGAAPEYHWVAESRRAWCWGFILPLIVLILALVKPVWAILLIFIYPLQWLRLTLQIKQPFKKASLRAFFLIIGKFAEAIGQIKFLLHRYMRKQTKIIEYR
jgi:glycosyltransferase involved in cell wall biosynthesis